MQFTVPPRTANKLISPIKLPPEDRKDIVLSSLFFILSYAPSPFGFFIYVAFVPQLALYQRNRPSKSFIYGYLIGLIVNLCVLFWFLLYSAAGFSIIVILNAFQFAVLGWVLSTIFNKNSKIAILFFPVFWTFLEFSRQYGEFAFNWLNIAYTQTYFLYLIQFLDITGQSGVVFWICIINTLFYLLWINRSTISMVIKLGTTLLFFFLLPFLYSIYRMSEKPAAEGASIAYVQPNIDLETKWDAETQSENVQILTTMTDSILITNPDLIVWPETAIPYYIRDREEDFILLKSQIEFNNYHLLTGAIDYSLKNGKRFKYNAAYFFTPGYQEPEVYHKLLLVPGEEYFPLQNSLSDLFGTPESTQLTPGKNVVLFSMNLLPYKLNYNGDDWRISGRSSELKRFKISCVICYESVFPNLVHRFFDQGCDLLVVMTNDAWFGHTSQPFQHLQASVFRAIEQRCSVVRCANSGISSFIDPYGRQYLDSSLFHETSAQKVMPFRIHSSFYSQHGEFVGIICGILVISFLTSLILNVKLKIL